MPPLIYNINKWIFENEQFFKPPICNKLMYGDGQLKCFFVGGPNVRKDFHLEEGEELFYMLKGDMELIVEERQKMKTIKIKEGEIFLLPSRIPHSPQRRQDTIGLVIERERCEHEMDGLRYYIDGSLDVLYERWFHCDKVDVQLPPLIKEYYNSEQFKTGKPIAGTILEDKPVKQDFDRTMDEPFNLSTWLLDHDKSGKMSLFEDNYSSKIFALREGTHAPDEQSSETFLWQFKGHGSLSSEGETRELREGSVALVENGKTWTLTNGQSDVTLSVVMNPAK